MTESNKNGRFIPSLGYFSFWDSLYYDDITHEGVIHHAYFLRFFEHAREHMLEDQFLANLFDERRTMFVAVQSDQQFSMSEKVKEATRVGNPVNVRTKVEVEGKFRIRFLNSLYICQDRVENSDDAVLVCDGFVDMVVVNADSNRVVPLPDEVFDEDQMTKVQRQPVKKPLRKPKNATTSTSRANSQFASDMEMAVLEDLFKDCVWNVSKFDTDFTKVVYQAKYLQYYELARESVLPALMTRFGCQYEKIQGGELELQVRKAVVKFKEPAVYGDDIIVRITNVELDGQYRLIFEQEMVKATTDKVLNQSKVELICIDPATQQLAPLPFP